MILRILTFLLLLAALGASPAQAGPSKVVVSGTLTPDATGTYTLTGTVYNGKQTWLKDGGGRAIWYFGTEGGTGRWIISPAANNLTAFWDSISQGHFYLLGAYAASTGTTGAATVAQVTTVPLAMQRVIVFDGNSMTDKATSYYPPLAMDAFGWGGTVYGNAGVSGQTTAQMITRAATYVDPIYRAGALMNAVVAWEMTNDLRNAATDSSTTIYNRYKSYCTARRTAGWKVVAVTILPRTQVGLRSDFEAWRTAINADMRLHYTDYADALADVCSDSRIGDFGDSDNATYFSDGIHPTIAGYGIVAGIVAPAITSLIPTSTPTAGKRLPAILHAIGVY